MLKDHILMKDVFHHNVSVVLYKCIVIVELFIDLYKVWLSLLLDTIVRPIRQKWTAVSHSS